MLDVGLLGLVQVDLEQTGAVQTNPEVSIYMLIWRIFYWAKIALPSIVVGYLILLPTISAG